MLLYPHNSLSRKIHIEINAHETAIRMYQHVHMIGGLLTLILPLFGMFFWQRWPFGQLICLALLFVVGIVRIVTPVPDLYSQRYHARRRFIDLDSRAAWVGEVHESDKDTDEVKALQVEFSQIKGEAPTHSGERWKRAVKTVDKRRPIPTESQSPESDEDDAR